MTSPIPYDARRAQEQKDLLRSGTEKLDKLFKKVESRFESFCPPGVSPASVANSVIFAATQNTDLFKATPESLVMSAVMITRWGMTVGNTGWIVPFFNKDSGRHIAAPIGGYRGYCELFMASGVIAAFNAKEVREGDKFDPIEGTYPRIEHVANWRNTNSPIIASYCSLVTVHGGTLQEVMSLKQLEDLRATSKFFGPAKFKKVPYSYARKCPVLRIAKTAPKSPVIFKAFADTRLPLAISQINSAGDPKEEVMKMLSEGNLDEAFESKAKSFEELDAAEVVR